MGERRFHGKLSADYVLFKRARAHWDELEQQVGRAIARHGRGRGPMTVLDLGCGTGFTAAAILARSPKTRLIALDNEPQMTRQASKNLREWVRAGLVLVKRADALSWLRRARTGSLDAVGSVFTIHNLERGYRSRLLREIRRALKPGGLFVNADKYALAPKPQAKVLRAQIARYFDVLVPLGRHDLFDEVVRHYMADEGPDRVMRESDSVRELRALRFSSNRRVFRRGMDAVYLAVK